MDSGGIQAEATPRGERGGSESTTVKAMALASLRRTCLAAASTITSGIRDISNYSGC